MTAPRAGWTDELPVTRPTGPRSVWRFPALAWLLAFSIALALPLIAAASATSAEVAEPALTRLVDGLTGTEALLRAEEGRLRQAAAEAQPGALVQVPGFPVRGVGIPREEVLAGTREEWQRTLLNRAAVVLYDEGTRAFAEHTEASRFESGGGAWVLSLLVGEVHGWLVFIQWIPVVASLVLTVGIIVMHPPVRRWRVLGMTMAVGAAPPLLLTLVTLVLAVLAGGPPGTLSGEAADVVATLTRAPLIQASTVAFGGLVLWWWAGRPVLEDDDTAARLATARAEREARRRAAAGLPPEPRRPR